MKKVVKFDEFGKEDTLSFNILRLAELERITGNSIQQIWDDVQNGKLGINFILQALPLCLDNRTKIERDKINEELEQALENGKNIFKILNLILQAILISGIFGEQKEVEKK